MNNFDFANKRLDEAFRVLCSKLYLKAESQQLDRVIEAFAKRFYQCNPTTLLHSADIVYAVSYSLLLLNTDLHITSGKAKKMSRSSFVKNTMETVQELMFPSANSQKRRVNSFKSSESYEFRRRSLSVSAPFFQDDGFKHNKGDLNLYESANNTLFQKLESIKSTTIQKNSRKDQTICSLEDLGRPKKTWILDIEALLKEMYNSVKYRRIDSLVYNGKFFGCIKESKNMFRNEKKREFRKRRGHSVLAETSTEIHLFNSLPSDRRLTEPSIAFDKKLFQKYQQGIVMRKHVMESPDKKAKNRQWELCYILVKETEVVMYKAIEQTEPKEKKKRSMMFWNPPLSSSFSLKEMVANGTKKWLPDLNQPPLDTIPLNHCYATKVLAPGWNRKRLHVFRLETAEGALWMFESTDMFAIQAWVEAINFSAACITKSLTSEAIGNTDYGWGVDREYSESSNKSKVPFWHPPLPCMALSTLNLENQYEDLKTQIKEATSQLEMHRELRHCLEKKVVDRFENLRERGLILLSETNRATSILLIVKTISKLLKTGRRNFIMFPMSCLSLGVIVIPLNLELPLSFV
ncbi:hypothetical protein BY458DRAFT_577024 [Sporodiniella umbellata]|nr:hypothetical protein BY458DRAFT_577024 [Sporodiniella umbellata]